MGCNCGSGKSPSTKYELTTEADPAGRVFLSETEAEVARVRAGGGTITRIA